MESRAANMLRPAALVVGVAAVFGLALMSGGAHADPGDEETGGPPGPNVLEEEPDDIGIDELWDDLGPAPEPAPPKDQQKAAKPAPAAPAAPTVDKAQPSVATPRSARPSARPPVTKKAATAKPTPKRAAVAAPARPVEVTPRPRPAHAPATPTPRRPLKRYALVIGIDGVRPDALQRARTPHLARLASEGAISYRAEAASVTLSGPGWAALLTGVERDKHRVLNNRLGEGALNGWPTFFGRLRDARPSARTAAFVAWKPLHEFMLAPKNLDTSKYFRADARVTKEAAATLKGDDVDLTFIHLDHVDRVGHKHGYSRSGRVYINAIEAADARVGVLLAAIAQRPERESEEWLIVVTTDHGGTGTRHGANRPTDRRIFFLAHGPTVERGRIPGTPSLLDVGPTVLTHLGVRVDPGWQLEGRAVGLTAKTVAEAPAVGPRTAISPAR